MRSYKCGHTLEELKKAEIKKIRASFGSALWNGLRTNYEGYSLQAVPRCLATRPHVTGHAPPRNTSEPGNRRALHFMCGSKTSPTSPVFPSKEIEGTWRFGRCQTLSTKTLFKETVAY